MSDRGKVRKHNEDAGGMFVSKANQYLGVVADGMGGHNAGDVASQIVVDYFEKHFPNQEKIQDTSQAEMYLLEAVNEINQLILSQAQADNALQGMGTTIVLALFVNDDVVILHVGDSRCYLLNQTHFTLLTSDHSLANVLYESGEISKDEAKQHPRKNMLTKALGPDAEVNPDVTSLAFEVKNRLLICTDGLTNNVPDDELAAHLKVNDSIEVIAEQLIALANQRGGQDNITVLIVEKGGQSQC